MPLLRMALRIRGEIEEKIREQGRREYRREYNQRLCEALERFGFDDADGHRALAFSLPRKWSSFWPARARGVASPRGW